MATCHQNHCCLSLKYQKCAQIIIFYPTIDIALHLIDTYLHFYSYLKCQKLLYFLFSYMTFGYSAIYHMNIVTTGDWLTEIRGTYWMFMISNQRGNVRLHSPMYCQCSISGICYSLKRKGAGLFPKYSILHIKSFVHSWCIFLPQV